MATSRIPYLPHFPCSEAPSYSNPAAIPHTSPATCSDYQTRKLFDSFPYGTNLVSADLDDACFNLPYDDEHPQTDHDAQASDRRSQRSAPGNEQHPRSSHLELPVFQHPHVPHPCSIPHTQYDP